jgi:hypothetical protein
MTDIRTDQKVQQALITYFRSALVQKSVKIKSSSRGIKHLRIEHRSDIKTLITRIHPSKVESSDVVISGAYKTTRVTIQRQIEGIAKRGDAFYIVNAISDRGNLTAKNLTPDELGLAGRSYTKTALTNRPLVSAKILLIL